MSKSDRWKHYLMTWNIRRKMLLFCLLLLIVPSTIIAYIGYTEAKDETDVLIHKNLENSVRLMRENIRQLETMAANGSISREAAQEDIKELLLGAKQEDGSRPLNPDIDLGSNGYFYVLDDQGVLLAHPNEEGENIWDKKTSDGFYYIQDTINQGKSGGGFTSYNWPLPDESKEATKIVYALEIPEWNWILAAGSYYMDYNQGQTRILYATLTTALLCMALGAIGVWLFSNHIARPIGKIADETRKVATGDLTSESLNITNRDEIGRLASDFNTMKEYLKSLVTQVMLSSDQVQGSSQTLQSSIDETLKASRHIATSTQQISVGIETQAISTQQSSDAMAEMAQGIQRIADAASEVYDSSLNAQSEAANGQGMIEQSINKMQIAKGSIEEISQVMVQLSKRSTEIGKIVNVMSEIAAQTGLLSLNASIEAARAGEQGKGFAVVAQEVKKLAEISQHSAKQIGELVLNVQHDIESANSTTENGILEFQQGMQVVEQTSMAFERITQSVQQVVGQVEESSAAAEQMSASSEEIYASLQELDRIASKSAENSEMISAASEQQIATMEEISHSSSNLLDLAEELKGLAHRFRIEEMNRGDQ